MAAQNLETVPRCDLCGNQAFEPEVRLPEYLLFTGEEFQLVRCTGCDLRFVNPRPPREDIGNYYPKGYYAHQRNPPPLKWWHKRLGAPGQPSPKPWERPVLRVLESVSWYAIPRYHGDGKILDVGCGGGKLLDLARALGWETYGVEPSPDGAQAAAAGGHQVQCATAETFAVGRAGSDADKSSPGSRPAGFQPDMFDVVYMWHVLEHTHSPRAALEACLRVLKPGGTLMLCVPNYASFHSRLFGRYWWSTDAPRHLYQFERSTLSRYLAEVGFENISSTTRTGTSSWVRGVRHTLNGRLGTRLENDPGWALALGEVPVVVSSLFGFFGVGSELRVTCHKPGAEPCRN